MFVLDKSMTYCKTLFDSYQRRLQQLCKHEKFFKNKWIFYESSMPDLICMECGTNMIVHTPSVVQQQSVLPHKRKKESSSQTTTITVPENE